jgi:hypothetical protein
MHGALGLEQEEMVAYAPFCLGALGLEQEKATYAPCCPGALGLK